MKYLLDTHAWVWWNLHPERLSSPVRQLIADPKSYDELLLSAISPWEFCKLLEKNRLTLSLRGDIWMKKAFEALCVRVVPLTPEISWHSTTLPSPFHDDPADQIIVATARLEEACLITRDQLIRDYPHVQTLW